MQLYHTGVGKNLRDEVVTSKRCCRMCGEAIKVTVVPNSAQSRALY